MLNASYTPGIELNTLLRITSFHYKWRRHCWTYTVQLVSEIIDIKGWGQPIGQHPGQPLPLVVQLGICGQRALLGSLRVTLQRECFHRHQPEGRALEWLLQGPIGIDAPRSYHKRSLDYMIKPWKGTLQSYPLRGCTCLHLLPYLLTKAKPCCSSFHIYFS